jgi:hypothetical protein
MVNRTQALILGSFLEAVTSLLVLLAAAPEVYDQALRLPTGNRPPTGRGPSRAGPRTWPTSPHSGTGPSSRRHTESITETMAELADLGLVGAASAEVRVHGGTPTFKLYILNDSEAFFGFYPLTEHTMALHGQAVPMYNLMGKDVTLFVCNDLAVAVVARV